MALQRLKLRDVCEIDGARNPHRNIPYVGMEDIESNTGRFLGKLVPRGVKSITFHFTPEHLLYGRLRPYLNKVLLPDFSGHCSTEIFPLKPKALVDRRFLFYWLTSAPMVEKINAGCTGARMPRANMEQVLNLGIPVPSLQEQKRVVAVLDEAFGAIAKAKENAEKNLANARELFESYSRSVFANPARGWLKEKLGEIADIEYGFTDNAGHIGDYRYIRITDIDKNGNLEKDNKVFVAASDEAKKFLLKDGDLLMARTGATYAKVLLFENLEKSIFASYLIRIVFKVDFVNKLYWYFSKSKIYWDQANKLSSGSAQPQFNGAALKEIIFWFPKSLKEQKGIVAKFDALYGETRKLEAIYHNKLANLEELKKSILQKAFSGELVGARS
jgi:type I restriction enzyme S subunit